MTDDSKQELVECLQQTAIFTKQLIRLNVLDLAIKAAQEGKDFRETLKRLSNYAQTQTTEEPQEQPISEIEKSIAEFLDSVVSAEQKVRKQINSESIEDSRGGG